MLTLAVESLELHIGGKTPSTDRVYALVHIKGSRATGQYLKGDGKNLTRDLNEIYLSTKSADEAAKFGRQHGHTVIE